MDEKFGQSSLDSPSPYGIYQRYPVLFSWCLGWYEGSKMVSFMPGALVGYLEHWVQLGYSLFTYHLMSSPCDLFSKVIKLLTWLLMVSKDQGKSCKSAYDLPLEVKEHHFYAFYQLKLFTGPTRFKNMGLHRDMITGMNGYRSHMLKSTTPKHSQTTVIWHHFLPLHWNYNLWGKDFLVVKSNAWFSGLALLTFSLNWTLLTNSLVELSSPGSWFAFYFSGCFSVS